MLDLNKVKGIIFDYGGTIDSNGKHWAWVLWDTYEEHKVPVTKEQFKEAYVYAERYLEAHSLIKPNHNFLDVLKIKVKLQINYLSEKGFLTESFKNEEYILGVSDQCYTFVRNLISEEKPYLKQLTDKYPMILVSNFYGNLQAVLQDFEILDLFDDIVESAVVDIRKPDARIFELGVERMNLSASEIVVIGDSYKNDIAPATKIGCKTIWLKGLGWAEEGDGAVADIIIKDFDELKEIFQLHEA